MWEEPYVVAGAQVAALMPPNVPLVFSTFQNIRKTYPLPFRRMERFVLGRSSGWISYGETVTATLRDRPGYTSLRTVTIPPGVDADLFRPNAEARAATLRRLDWPEEGPPIVGYLGRFVPEKGLDFILSVLDAQTLPWRALFVGTGPFEATLRRWGAKHGSRVAIVNDARHDDVPRVLNAMDVLVAPSETTASWREQFGRMIVEAFACGVPVLSSDSGELPFTVGDGGLVRKERDHAAWTATVGELLGSAERRRDLQRAGRDRATGVFAWPVVARQTLDFFSSILTERDATRAAARPVAS